MKVWYGHELNSREGTNGMHIKCPCYILSNIMHVYHNDLHTCPCGIVMSIYLAFLQQMHLEKHKMKDFIQPQQLYILSIYTHLAYSG